MFEFLAEFPAARFEEFHVRLAVGFHVSSHDETVIGSDLLGVPSLKFGFLFGGHAVWVIIGRIGYGSIIVLVF